MSGRLQEFGDPLNLAALCSRILAKRAGSQLHTILRQQQNYNYNAVHALIAYLGRPTVINSSESRSAVT